MPLRDPEKGTNPELESLPTTRSPCRKLSSHAESVNPSLR
jgi:hypothetical protein